MTRPGKTPRIRGWLIALLALPAAAVAADGYDAAPFVQALSVPFQKNPAARMGLNDLSDLPLYQLEITLDAAAGLLQVRQEIIYKNLTPGAIPDLVVRTFPNVPAVSGGAGRNLVFEEVTVDGAKVAPRVVNPSAWRIALPRPLPPGGRVLLGLRYTAALPAVDPPGMGDGDLDGLLQGLMGGRSQGGYGIFGRCQGVFSLGHFYPILPARVGGDWDTGLPTGIGDVAHFEVANYLVTLRLPRALQVASSGSQVGEKPLPSEDDDRKEVYLLGTALREFALQISDRYRIRQTRVDDVLLRYFYLAERTGEADAVLDEAAGALRTFQHLLGPYPYAELDVVDAPLVGGAGGMEYPGLVTLASLLTESRADDPTGALLAQFMGATGTVEFVLAHEIAHQWFNVQVGSDSGRHPFLDEALANYAAVLFFEEARGADAATSQIELELVLPYQLFRSLGGKDGVVDRAASEFGSTLEYTALVYGKGALGLHALRRALGKQAFLKGLRGYVSRQAFRQAQPADLERALADASGKAPRVKALFGRWFRQARADQDWASLGLPDLDGLLGKLQNLQGLGGPKIRMDGAPDPAVLKLFEQALQGLTGP